MALASQTQHKVIPNTALPYVSNTSLLNTNPHFIQGSQNIMTSLRGWSERRPAFSSTVEQAASVFSYASRIFFWRRWVSSTPNGGAFVAMLSDGGKVYKMVQGVDVSFQLIFTSSSSEPFDFVVANNTCYFGNGTDMMQYDTNRTVSWGISAPVAGPGLSLIGGANNVYTSWCYCCTYYDSYNLAESSPSPISACSGVFTGKTVQLSLTASTNPRVTNIRVYRTPDGGAQDPALMQEIVGSPFPNSTTTQNDTTIDQNLSTRVAPEFLRNDPPTPSKGFVAYGGRIWGFINNTTYFSGNEEIQNGVPQECWPSGLAGNNYPWDNEVTAHAPLIDGVAIYTASRIYKIEGDSLDTFRRYQLLDKRGTRSRTAVSSVGGSVLWLDTSNTIWISDIGEIGIPIRPDIAPINPLTAYTALHISGIYHWACLLDGTNGLLYVYDLDTERWMPPWSVGGNSSALASFETSLGVIDLMIARGGSKALKLVSGTYTDDASTYNSQQITNLFRSTPDDNPALRGNLDWIELKTDASTASSVQILTDDDPTIQTYQDITSTVIDSPDIQQGQYLKTLRYPNGGQFEPQCQMVSLKMGWGSVNSNFHLYQIDLASHPVGA